MKSAITLVVTALAFSEPAAASAQHHVRSGGPAARTPATRAQFDGSPVEPSPLSISHPLGTNISTVRLPSIQGPGEAGPGPFDARPWTYGPRRLSDRRPPSAAALAGDYYLPDYRVQGSDPPSIAADFSETAARVRAANVTHGQPDRSPTASAERADEAPGPSIRPLEPTTIYVIPGCYGGNVPPELNRLASGCSSTNLRLIRLGGSN